MLTKEALGERIKQLMKDKCLTQKALSESIGITQAKLSNYVNAKNYPPIDVLAQLAENLQVSVDYLVNGTVAVDSASEMQYTFNTCGDVARMLISLFSVVDAHIYSQSETYEKTIQSPDMDIYSRETHTLSRMRYFITFGGSDEWNDVENALNGFLGEWTERENSVEKAVKLLDRLDEKKKLGQEVRQLLPSWKREQARALDSISLLDLNEESSFTELPDDDDFTELPF